MRFEIWSLSFLLLASLSWDSNAQIYLTSKQNYGVLKLKLSSGKELRDSLVDILYPLHTRDYLDRDFIPLGLRLRYVIDAPVDDKAALRKEVDEIWEVFQKDIEDAHLKIGQIWPIKPVDPNLNAPKEVPLFPIPANEVPLFPIPAKEVPLFPILANAPIHKFEFEKRDDGKWHCLDDDKKKE